MADDVSVACDKDPNFAVICNFLDNFKDLLGLPDYPYQDLQNDIKNTSKLSDKLLDLILKLLRRAKKSVKVDKWQRSLVKFASSYSDADAWEFTEYVFQECKLDTKLRAVKTLMEAQFDCHAKFKEKINEKKPTELRQIPIGRDKRGYQYWYLVDDECNVRVYCEEVDDTDNSTWTVLVRNKDDLSELITKLEVGDIPTNNSQENSRSATPASILSSEQEIKSTTPIPKSETVEVDESKESVKVTKEEIEPSMSQETENAINEKVESEKKDEVKEVTGEVKQESVKEESPIETEIKIKVEPKLEVASEPDIEVKDQMNKENLETTNDTNVEKTVQDAIKTEKEQKEEQSESPTDNTTAAQANVLETKDENIEKPEPPKSQQEESPASNAIPPSNQDSPEVLPENRKRKRASLEGEENVNSEVSDSSSNESNPEAPPNKKQKPRVKVCPKHPRKRAGQSPEPSTDEDEEKAPQDKEKSNDEEKEEIPEEQNDTLDDVKEDAPKVKKPGRKPGSKTKKKFDEDRDTPLRRSSRSTKGQKPKELYVIEAPPTKRKLKLLELEEEMREFPSSDSENGANSSKSGKERKKKKKKSEESKENGENKKEDYDESDDDFKPWKKDGSKKKKKKKKTKKRLTTHSSEDELFRENEEEVSLFSTDSSADECDEDIAEGDEEYIPTGRNAKRSKAIKEKQVINDDTPCQVCKKYDQPEWILLCDTCDLGYHAMCLRPPLMKIPDGDWHCPVCEHAKLIEKLKSQLQILEVEWKKQEASRRRKQRLAYVNISLDNVIKEQNQNPRKPPQRNKRMSSYSEEEQSQSYSSAESSCYSDGEQLRASRNTKKRVNYTFTDYDETISKAIGEEVRETYGAGNYGRGKDIANIEAAAAADDNDGKPMGVMAARQMYKKKKSRRKLTALDSDEGGGGEDDESDDYKASDRDSVGSEYSPGQSDATYSEDEYYGGKKRKSGASIGWTSSRSRRKREMEDFVVDDDEVSDFDEFVWSNKKKRSSKTGRSRRALESSEEEDEEEDESDEDYDPKRHRKRKLNSLEPEEDPEKGKTSATSRKLEKSMAMKQFEKTKKRTSLQSESETEEEVEEEPTGDTTEDSVESEAWRESSDEDEKPKRRLSKIASSSETEEELEEETVPTDQTSEHLSQNGENGKNPTNKFSIASLLDKNLTPVEGLEDSLPEAPGDDDNLQVDELINFVTQSTA